MPIIHTLNKNEDNFILSVGQDTSYILTYILDKVKTIIVEDFIFENDVVNLLTPKDGSYELILKVEGETNVVETFDVISNLQNSIILDVFNLICNNGNCYDTENCLTKESKQLLKAKNIFNKLLSYQYTYLKKYNSDVVLDFNSYISKAILLSNCGVQSKINEIIVDECVGSNESIDLKLMYSYIYLYWTGMYFTDLKRAIQNNIDTETFVKEKYYYSSITKCGCNLCFNFEDLMETFGLNEETFTEEYYTFQFNSTTKGIADVGEIDDVYLETTATSHTEESLDTGKEAVFTLLGRVGVAIKTETEDNYNIFDALNANITNISFDKVYDDINNIQYYVSKSVFIPSNIFIKITKK